jgi:hypothetical protein
VSPPDGAPHIYAPPPPSATNDVTCTRVLDLERDFSPRRPATLDDRSRPGVAFAPVGIEARFRAVEQRIAVANGLDVQERWVETASPAVKVRVLESGVGDPVLFINGIAAPGIGMAALAGRLPGHRLNLRVRSPALASICRWACSPRRLSVASRPRWRGCRRPGSSVVWGCGPP